jgi:hypothetical protein
MEILDITPLLGTHPPGVLDTLLGDPSLHREFTNAFCVGIAGADASPLLYSPKIHGNLQRFFHVFDAVARICVELGFTHYRGGISQHMEMVCPITKKSVRLNLMSFTDFTPKQGIFHVRKKGRTALENIAHNWNESHTESLFDMEELIENEILNFEKFQALSYQTVTLFYSYSGYAEAEEVAVFIAYPNGMDESKTLIECQHITHIGTFPIYSPHEPTIEENLLTAPDFAPIIEPIENNDGESL